jgi:predicted O-methyltransferase YrrM
MREPRRLGHLDVEDDEQVESRESCDDLALVRERDRRVAPDADEGADLVIPRRQDLVGEDVDRHLADEAPEAAEARSRTRAPERARRVDVGVARFSRRERAGVADRIELRIGPGIETLRSLPKEPQFDFAFIDADKPGYPGYYEEILPRLRQGGLMLIDNVLQNGRVIDESAQDENVEAIRALNDAIVADPRVRVMLLPIGDGVSVVQKI